MFKVEVTFPTSRPLTEDEKQEILFGVYYAMKDKLPEWAVNIDALPTRAIVQEAKPQ